MGLVGALRLPTLQINNEITVGRVSAARPPYFNRTRHLSCPRYPPTKKAAVAAFFICTAQCAFTRPGIRG
jgi:hypothetical protein